MYQTPFQSSAKWTLTQREPLSRWFQRITKLHIGLTTNASTIKKKKDASGKLDVMSEQHWEINIFNKIPGTRKQRRDLLELQYLRACKSTNQSDQQQEQ